MSKPKIYQPLPLEKLKPADVDADSVFQKPQDRLKLEADVANVIEGRVNIETFDLEYQKKIKDFYRFSAREFNKYLSYIPPRIREILEIV